MVQGRVILALAFATLAGGAHAGPLDAEMGRALFERNWVAAPSSTGSDDGLGPLYDARSCSSCHAGGGPGRVAAIGRGSVVRIGNARGAGDSVYGTQFQVSALPGLVPEGAVTIGDRAHDGLRAFTLDVHGLGYGAMAAGPRLALRRAPSLRGIGLLASVPGARFGWKATQPTVAAQVEMALLRDIGLSTTGHPDPWGECTVAESACRAGRHRAKPGEVEVSDSLRNLIVAYVVSIAPPPPLNVASHGHGVFVQIGCASCHGSPRGAGGRRVAAYTDLTLHDMGSGLDDGIAEGNARPSEWRTAPLWDVAAELAAGGLLHDGRARSVAEAIAWHGGEASRARANFGALTAADKAALVAFLMGR